MEREMEIKVLDIDREAVEADLIAFGAKKVSEEVHQTVRINSDAHPVDEEKGYLRIRRVVKESDERIEMTFKEKIGEGAVKLYDEHTALIDEMESMRKILALLGFNRQIYGKKHRISYEKDGLRFDLDRWDADTFPVPYMEIEGPNAEAIYEAVRALGLPEDRISSKTIGELKESWNK
ncbi:putative adenylyl cyclase CyaB [Aedoeadaptatus ivorii]|uniref:Putative adenylyl cyclase CyaB n=1 Tax=Aedoeadaptatus ivorii TaxID=54006 RepID=A0A3S5C2K2_9FIRM|nr:class IV adenylate cyclase [Peptoniphilus ivorii]VEJ35799.1 putative adenylyl cyclase CyaB [Peptoniphilus ivorii]